MSFFLGGPGGCAPVAAAVFAFGFLGLDAMSPSVLAKIFSFKGTGNPGAGRAIKNSRADWNCYQCSRSICVEPRPARIGTQLERQVNDRTSFDCSRSQPGGGRGA